ncbi:MAG: NAD(P)H-binding protein [Stackebrandtia sp.]
MILITTPTGQIGQSVAEEVLHSGRPVRVVARDPARLSTVIRERAEIVTGRHDDPAVLAKAAAGADRVFWLIPPDPRAESVFGHYRRFTRALCEAIASQGITHVVAVSTVGRGTDSRAGYVSAALLMDEMIEATGVNYRALAAPGFMENLLQQVVSIRDRGEFYSAIPGDHPQTPCATRDIAAAAAGLLLDDSWSGQDSVPLLGAEDLSNKDMARIMSEVLDRPVGFRQVSLDDLREGLLHSGTSPAFAEGMIDMTREYEQIARNTPKRTPEFTTATTFRQWCTEVLKPAVTN